MHKYNILYYSIYEGIYINNFSQNNIENKKTKIKNLNFKTCITILGH